MPLYLRNPDYVGHTIYVTFNGTSIALPSTAGTGSKTDQFSVLDTAIAGASLPAGEYSGDWREGNYLSPSESDAQAGVFDGFVFDGSVEQTISSILTRLGTPTFGSIAADLTTLFNPAGPAANRPVAADFTITVPKRSITAAASTAPTRTRSPELVTLKVVFDSVLAVGESLESIVSITKSNSEPLTFVALGTDQGSAIFTVNGGTGGITYNVTVTTLTSNGNKFVHTFPLAIFA